MMHSSGAFVVVAVMVGGGARAASGGGGGREAPGSMGPMNGSGSEKRLEMVSSDPVIVEVEADEEVVG